MQRYGGVSRSFSELIKEFHENPDLGISPSITFTRTNNDYLKDLTFLDFKPQKHFFSASGGLSTLLTLGPVRATSSLWAGGALTENSTQILHATYYRPTWLERRSAGKLVVTIHDFIPEILGWTGVRNPHIGKKRMCQRADKIISVSYATTELLVNMFDVSQDRIETIHHGVRTKTELGVEKKDVVDSTPSVLYVGHRGGYKNFQVLLKAIMLAHLRGIDVQLITAGPKLTTLETDQGAILLRLGLWKHFTAPEDGLLSDLYKKATVHVVTSSMEGFGLTILESMSYATPTLLSDIPVFREVAGQNALYFDASSEESLLANLQAILDSTTYSHLSFLSLEHAKKNSWESAAQRYANVYSEMLS